jgi:mono/diheme cytochrome c family protein
MKRLAKWLGAGLAVLVLLGGAGLGVLYATTQSQLRRPEMQVTAVLPVGDPKEGARLAQVLGCRGCHQDDLSGAVFMEQPNVLRLVAPNLTRVRDDYDAAAWVRLMRTGTKADGTLAIGMPNAAHQRLTDREIADLVAYVRAAPRVDTAGLGTTRLWPLARLGMVTGKFRVETLAGDTPESPQVLAQRGTQDRGEHLAYIACSGCHGADLEGGDAATHHAPPLKVTKAYDARSFARLLRTGTTLAGTDSATGMMSQVSRRHFSSLTDGEIADLHAYLINR